MIVSKTEVWLAKMHVYIVSINGHRKRKILQNKKKKTSYISYNMM